MAHKRITKEQLLANPPINFLAFGAGSGMAPVAPGTFGTLAAIPVWFLLPNNLWVYLITVAVLFAVGVWLCERCSQSLGEHDHPGIVFDEWVGYFITMIAVPKSIWLIALGFVLFRLFDVLKPWPIGELDKRVSGGFGIMIDDVIAGIFAGISLHLILLLLGYFGVSVGALTP